MSDNNFITFREETLLVKMFQTYVLDHDLPIWENDSELRCAIYAFVNHVQNVLADYYNADREEGDEDDLG